MLPPPEGRVAFMDEKQRKQLEELEDKAIHQVARALVSIARELVRKEDAGDKEVDELLQDLRGRMYNGHVDPLP